ncbi:MAG: phage portal protein, partial [Desulfobacteraceae bacterium]
MDRLRSRFVMAMADAYTGSSRRRRALKEWIVSLGDADTDISGEIDDLRSRSGDLERNNPLARGAINTKVTGVVGTGLRLKANIDRKILNMTDDQADEWEAKTESEFSMWANSTDCDVEDVLKFHQIQELVFRSTLSRGDVFVLTPAKERKERPYNLQLQLIEADRVCNKNNQSDTDLLSGGIEREKYGGKPVKCHILKGHPGNIWSDTSKWDVVEFRGEKTGRRNVLHIFHKTRIGQSRGVPDLAPVIEKLKQLGRYSESELNNAVLSSFF